MKLITFAAPGRPGSRVGVLRGDSEVVDIAEIGGRPPFDARDMLSLIERGEKALSWIRKRLNDVKSTIPLTTVKLLAPIPRPRKNLFCVGWNYLEHFREGEKSRPHVQDMPAHPTFFSRAPTSLLAAYDDIPHDTRITEKLDWEAELGVIIGIAGKNIAEVEAMKHVFGYTVMNDVSGRDVQRRHGQQWFKGKSLDGTCPMGPWIVTADEIEDPHNLAITCLLNGVTKQHSTTACMYFKLPRIIAELSLGMTLEAGDVILTGTPNGVGHARTPPEFMKPGDVLETSIAGVGSLKNRVVSVVA